MRESVDIYATESKNNAFVLTLVLVYHACPALSIWRKKKKKRGQSRDKGNVMSMNVVYEMLPENELIFIIL